MVYYGTEQYFGGKQDPYNREPIWKNMNRESRLYKMLAAMNGLRKSHEIWNKPQIERYLDNEIFVFSRGFVTVAVTNRDTTQTRQVTFHPYSEGTQLCNIFYASDCVKVEGGKFQVTLVGGEPKVYEPRHA
jgi:alpha-amylase